MERMDFFLAVPYYEDAIYIHSFYLSNTNATKMHKSLLIFCFIDRKAAHTILLTQLPKKGSKRRYYSSSSTSSSNVVKKITTQPVLLLLLVLVLVLESSSRRSYKYRKEQE